MTNKMFYFFISALFLGFFAFTGCDDADTRLGAGPGSPLNTALDGPSDIVRLTDDDFTDQTAQGIVLVDFYADWCGPCRKMEPEIEALATKMKDQLIVVKVDIDKSPKTARKFGVQGIPALFVLVDGKPVKNATGYHDEVGLRNFIADPLIEHGGKKKGEENPGVQDAGLNGN